MNKTEQTISRPILVWENSKANGSGEATVREIHTGTGEAATMPVIRVVSSGFGTHRDVQSSASTNNRLRCAA